MFWHFWVHRKHHFIKNIMNVCIWAFVGFGFYLLFLADERFQPYPKFQAGMAFLSVFAMFIPYLVFHFTALRDHHSAATLLYFEFLVAAPLILNGIGARWLYDMSDWYDALVHFANTSFLTALAASLVWLLWPTLIDRMPIVLFLLIAGSMFLAGILFEGFEAVSDTYWRTSMWGDGHLNIVADTVQDILANIAGALIACLVFFLGGYRKLNHLRTLHA